MKQFISKKDFDDSEKDKETIKDIGKILKNLGFGLEEEIYQELPLDMISVQFLSVATMSNIKLPRRLELKKEKNKDFKNQYIGKLSKSLDLQEELKKEKNEDFNNALKNFYIGKLSRSLDLQEELKKKVNEDYETIIKNLKKVEKSVSSCFPDYKLYEFEFKDFESNKESYSDFIKEVINEYRVKKFYLCFRNYFDDCTFLYNSQNNCKLILNY